MRKMFVGVRVSSKEDLKKFLAKYANALLQAPGLAPGPDIHHYVTDPTLNPNAVRASAVWADILSDVFSEMDNFEPTHARFQGASSSVGSALCP